MAKVRNPPKDPNAQRSRKFCLTSYHPVEVIEGVLAHRPVRAAVYIVHDKDIYDEEDEKKNPDHKAGALKEKHVHILLCTNNAATLGQVRRWFPSNQNTLGQVLRDDEMMLRYLTHKDDPEKAQYDDSEVKTFGEGKEPFIRAAFCSGHDNETVEDLINDINSGVDRRTLMRRYGREYVKNENTYRRFAYALEREENPNSAYRAQQEWRKLCELHDVGVISDYDFARYEQYYGVQNPLFSKY